MSEPGPALLSPASPRHEGRNTLVLAIYQIVIRVGWIFKTESIIIPAFLDWIVHYPALRGTLRGCLPVLNRFGHSIPPVLVSRRLKLMPQKKWALAIGTLAMGGFFLLLAGIFLGFDVVGSGWFPWIFLAIYGLFFVATGIVQLALGTLQGKLIRHNRHGRLMVWQTAIGSPLAILAAWLWLGDWLATPEQGFAAIFLFIGIAFSLAAAGALGLREPADHYQESANGLAHHFRSAWQVLREDRNFRRLAWVAMTFSTVLALFPHYQALGRMRLGITLNDLVWWVMVQNAGTGLFSFVAGPLSDRRGNRIVLRGAILACAITPLLATYLSFLSATDPATSRSLYWLVFLPVGFTPIVLKLLNNYALEISSPADHPRYLSTLNLCVSAPIILFSPLLGLLVTEARFERVFLLGAAVIVVSGLLTLRISEPRHAHGATTLLADEHPPLREQTFPVFRKKAG